MAVIDVVLDVGPEERSRLLGELVGDDVDLRREVEHLLDHEPAAVEFMEDQPPIQVDPPTMIGRQVGNYRITDEIGRGGMGTVYGAERADDQYQTRVAVKLIKRGMDTDYILRRFYNERQILANLSHPNIARLLDGGMTDDGLPYFVMEYIDGQPIDRYAEQHNLSTRERLELFRSSCAAVEFAHHLIIHRDIKPSNILVTADGVPKLLDFGIAKILRAEDEAADETGTMYRVMTPEYASPEQIRGDRVTKATDIYSLGVLLYELLTGTRPYRLESRRQEDIVRAICDEEPQRPSTAASLVEARTGTDSRAERRSLSRTLLGDLDNIVLMALRKDPSRRYTSVQQFSDDIGRHLDGRPVLAHKDSLAYRTAKFVRRNTVAVASAAAILITLVTGLIVTTWQAKVARAERSRAERRFNDVRQLANSFMFEVNESIKTSPIKARELLVERAIEYIDKLSAEEGNDPALQADLASAYERIGDIESELFKPNTGKSSEAVSSHLKALEIRRNLFESEPSPERALQLSGSYTKVGDLMMIGGKITEAREKYETAVRMLEPVAARNSDDLRIRRRLAGCFAGLGQVIVRSGSLREALDAYERSLKIFQDMRALEPNDQNDRNVGIVLSFIGFVRQEMGQHDESVRCYGEWLAIEQKISEKDPSDVVTLGHLSTAHVAYAFALSYIGEPANVRSHMERGTAIQEQLFERDRNNFGERLSLADDYLEFGKALLSQGSPVAARELFQKALDHYEAVSNNDPEDLWAKRRVSCARRWVGEALLLGGDLDLAFERLDRSLTETNELTAAHPDYSEWQLDLALCHLRLGELHLKRQQRGKAMEHFRLAMPVYARLAAESPDNAKRQKDLETITSYLDRSA